jgi:YbgC/YbaW family acyl-CoA thioester hydrolase
MQTMKKVLESKMKIRFHDCDPYNHLNNSRYIDYIVTARGDQLIEHYRFDTYQIARQQGVGWVAAQTQISYLAPALLMEEVLIETQLLGYSEKSLHVEGIMWNEAKTQIKAVLWAKLVHFNLHTQRSCTHAPDMMQLFRQVVNPPSVPVSFDERIQMLKQAYNPLKSLL